MQKPTGLDLIKQKLAELNKQAQKPSNSTGGGNNVFWKPGQTKDDKGISLTDQIRILPNPYTEEGYPFAELYFYYDFGKTWISPTCFQKHDPIVEYCNGLTSGGKLSKEEYVTKMQIKRKLMPKDRVYVPILVRGQESDGVKFWGFSKTIFNQILEIMADDDYGDITSLKTGRDMTVKYTPPSKEGEFGKTTIVVKPNQTVATDDPEVLDKIKNMPNVAELFTCPTEQELEDALAKYLKVEPEVKQTPSNPNNVRTNHAATNEGFDMTNFQVPGSEPKQPTSQVDVSDIERQFEDLLNGK